MRRALLALLLLGWSGPARGEEDLLPAFERAAEGAARETVVEGAPEAFAAEVVEALVRLEPGASSPLLEEAARAYLRVTGDSLLVADVVFAVTALPERRAAWARGIDETARGDSLQAASEYPEAAVAYEAAIASFRSAGHPRREAVAWGTLGTARLYAGDREGARASYERALTARRRLGDPFLVARALNTLGQLAAQGADYDAALAYLDEARRLREDLDIPEELAKTLVALGDVHVALANLETARTSYRRALDVLGPGSASPTVTRIHNGLGNVLSTLGEHREASEMYRSLLAAALARGDERTAAVLRRNLAGELIDLGDPAEALYLLRVTAAVEEREGDVYELAATLNRTGEALSVIGDLESALDSWRRAVAAADSTDNVLVADEARLNLAYGLGKAGLHEQALDIHEDLLAWSEGDSLLRGDILADMATLEYERGAYERALPLYREALALHEAGGDVPHALEDRTNLGMTLIAMGRPEEGRVELGRARIQAEELDYRAVLGEIYLNIADGADQIGDLPTARSFNAQAIEAMESLAGETLSEAARAAFLGSRASAYEAQVHVLARLAERTGDDAYRDDAFTVAERGKAQAFLAVLGEARLGLSPRLPMSLETRKVFIERAIKGTSYRLRLAEETAAMADSARVLRTRLDDLERTRAEILQMGRYEDPRFAVVDPGEPATREDVQSLLLDDQTALVEYALGDTVSYAWVLTERSASLHRLPGRDRIGGFVQDLRAALEADAGRLRGERLGEPPRGPDLARAATALGNTVLGPLLSEIHESGRVIIVPDGPLHFVPFELLLADVGGAEPVPGEWPSALGYHVVTYAPSATSLLFIETWRTTRAVGAEGFLGVGDPAFQGGGEAPLLAAVPGEASLRAGLSPLPYTRTEVERIGGLFGEGNRELLLGSLAKEKTLTEPGFLSRFRYLHFATHGFADERRPERSRIALSYPEDASEDGYLQASEVYGLDLQADLVVLSACDTGRGKMIRGEGVMGLPRAFLYAGAPAVVVSLWNVSDEATADLMTAFYDAMIREGLPPADALARAKQSLRSGGRWAHPFYWAAFVLVGAG